MLGEKFTAGAQAEIYEARLQPNVSFDLVVKVMMGDAPLQAFSRNGLLACCQHIPSLNICLICP